MLNQEECEKALEVLDCKAHYGCDKGYSQDEELCKICENKDFIEMDVLEQLIKEHFELIEKIKKIQDKFGVIPIEDILYAMLKDDANSENQWFPVLKKFRILTGDECDKLTNYENPQPYKFEDLKNNMWVWDDVFKEICFISLVVNRNKIYVEYLESHCSIEPYIIQPFEENRFYPVTKALQYQVGVD